MGAKRPCRNGRSTRGASLGEYALLLFAVLIVSAGALKLLGPPVRQNADDAGAWLVGDGPNRSASGNGSAGGAGAASGLANGGSAAGPSSQTGSATNQSSETMMSMATEMAKDIAKGVVCGSVSSGWC